MSYFLTAQNIDDASLEAVNYMKAHAISSKDITRVRLSLEEVLIRYASLFGEDTPFSLRFGYRLGKAVVRLSVKGGMFNPFSASDGENEEIDGVYRQILSKMGDAPVWQYKHGCNDISFSASKYTLPSWSHLLIAVALAVVCSSLLYIAPENVTQVVKNYIITPLMSLFMRCLNLVSGPMIFLSLVWGIYGVGDISVFHALGKKVVSKCFAISFAFSVAFCAGGIPFFHLLFGDELTSGSLSPIYDMLLEIVPENIVSPLFDGNTLQIIFLAVVSGIAMLMVAEKTDVVATAIEQLGYVVSSMMSSVSKLIPVFIFLSILNILTENGFAQLLPALKLIVMCCAALVLILLILTLYTASRVKVSPILLWKKVMPVFIIGITTASSASALSERLRVCTEKFGIKKSLVSFCAPLSAVLFAPPLTVTFFYSTIYVASVSGKDVSLSWLILTYVFCLSLAIAAPPVSGGPLASITILFTELGLDMTHLGIVLMVITLLDFCSTAATLTGNDLLMVSVAKDAGMLDREILLQNDSGK